MKSNFDSKINWEDFYRPYLKNMKRGGTNKVTALCPFHDDHNPSFWFNVENGCFKCEACGEKGNGQTFLEKIEGISREESWKRILAAAGEDASKEEKWTLKRYSDKKHLPLDYLKGLGLKNYKNGIVTPYYGVNGQVFRTRLRLEGKEFRWGRGSGTSLYGLHLLEDIKKAGYVILVEGESDPQTLWYHDLPALGVPGATCYQREWTELLEGLKLYLYREPEDSGDKFMSNTLKALKAVNFEGEIYQISIPDYKDPNELHINREGEFLKVWEEVMSAAIPLDLEEIENEEKIPGAPVSLKQPGGWKVTEKGIYMFNEYGFWESVCRTPVLLTRRMKSLSSDSEKIEIAFLRDGKWKTSIHQRSSLFQSRDILKLADLGVTVTSENASKLVKYLQDLEGENIDKLEILRSVNQLGWYGKNFLPGCEGDIVLDMDGAGHNWTSAYAREGSFEEWRKSMEPFRKNHIFRFVLASAFAAPLLKLLSHRIFLIHNWGDSRAGKTAALKAALSVWGDPEGLMVNFNATRVGLERLAGFFNDLPLGIDEKQVAGNRQEFIDSLVYMLSLGTGKVRGAKDGGLQATKNWRSIVLTTGEEPLTSESSQTGVYTRTIQIMGSPFNNEGEAGTMHRLVSKNYGHAGPMFIEKLLASLEENSEFLRELYEDIHRVLLTANEGKLGSHLSSVAVVAAADTLISRWIFEEEENSMDMAQAILLGLEDEKEADVVDRAYEFIRGWVISNINQFSLEAREIFGFEEGTRYYVHTHILQRALEQQGYSFRKILRGLGDRGKIEVSTSGGVKQYSVVKRTGGRLARFVGFDFDVTSNDLVVTQ